MMNKKQTSLRSIWKYALMIPVVALLLFFNSSFQTKAETDNTMNIVQTDNEMNITLADNEMNYDLQDPPTTQNKPKIYEPTDVEVPPSFPGGLEALVKWLGDNIRYSKEAIEQGISGRVYLRLVVTPDGSVDDVTLIRNLESNCDKEAVRAVKAMPKWLPGKQNGKPVHVYYYLPVNFQYQ